VADACVALLFSTVQGRTPTCTATAWATVKSRCRDLPALHASAPACAAGSERLLVRPAGDPVVATPGRIRAAVVQAREWGCAHAAFRPRSCGVDAVCGEKGCSTSDARMACGGAGHVRSRTV
jgi:hypothetical protein